jgi:two-component system alkaline phosphatase synthesis response regulator PhoP
MTGDIDQEVRNSTILIADDTEQNVELIQAYLDELGCRVVTAFDGQETLDRVAEAKPDLVLLDIMMPKLSGFEVCRKLKADPATRDIPICMVTALTEEGDIERAVEAGHGRLSLEADQQVGTADARPQSPSRPPSPE